MRPAIGLGQRQGDGRGGGARATGVLPGRLDGHLAGRLVLFQELTGSLVQQGDRAQLDLHRPAE